MTTFKFKAAQIVRLRAPFTGGLSLICLLLVDTHVAQAFSSRPKYDDLPGAFARKSQYKTQNAGDPAIVRKRGGRVDTGNVRLTSTQKKTFQDFFSKSPASHVGVQCPDAKDKMKVPKETAGEWIRRKVGIGQPVINKKHMVGRGQTRNTNSITSIVFHDAQGATTPQGIINAHKGNPKYHYAIDNDGNIFQLRPDNQTTGAHKGRATIPGTGGSANDTSIAIVFLGDMRPESRNRQKMNDKMTQAAINLTNSLRKHKNLKYIHNHGDHGTHNGLAHSSSDCTRGMPKDFDKLVAEHTELRA